MSLDKPPPDTSPPDKSPTHSSLVKPFKPFKPMQGQKQHFSPKQLQDLARHLEQSKQFRDLALLCLSVDSMLRSVDVLALRVRDVQDAEGRTHEGFVWRQQKTGQSVEVALNRPEFTGG